MTPDRYFERSKEILQRRQVLGQLPSPFIRLAVEAALDGSRFESKSMEVGTEQRLERALHMRSVLEGYMLKMGAEIDEWIGSCGVPDVSQRMINKKLHIDNGGRITSDHGLNIDQDMVFEIVWGIVNGSDVELAYSANFMSNWLERYKHTPVGQVSGEKALRSLEFAQMLSALGNDSENLRTTFVCPARVSTAQAALTLSILQENGFEEPNVISTPKISRQQASDAIEELKRSGRGEVLEKDDAIWFMPDENLTEWYRANKAQINEGYEFNPDDLSVPLFFDHYPVRMGSYEGVIAEEVSIASYSLSKLANILHRSKAANGKTIIVDMEDTSVYRPNSPLDAGTAILAKALNKIRWGHYIPVGIGQNILAYYSFAALALRHTNVLIADLEAGVDSSTMDVSSYAWRNYEQPIVENGEPLPQDVDIDRMEISMLPWIRYWLNIDSDRPETLLKDHELAHMCVGPGISTIMNSASLSDGVIAGYDLNPGVVTEFDRLRSGNKKEIYDRLEQHKVGLSREITDNPHNNEFVGSFRDVLERTEIFTRSIDADLEVHARLYRESFGRESLSRSRIITRARMEKTLNSMTRGDKTSILVMSIMLGYSEDGWSDGTDNGKFSGTRLDLNSAVAMVSDAGFRVVVAKIAAENLPNDQRLRNDEDMLFLVAVPEEQAHLLKNMPQLPPEVKRKAAKI